MEFVSIAGDLAGALQYFGWESRGGSVMGTIGSDIRYAARALAAAPGFALLAIITLALGIGANSTIFSWIDGTLLNPVPGVSNTSQLVTLSRSNSPRAPKEFSYEDYLDLRDQNTTLSGLAAASMHPVDITGGAHPEHTWGALASANYFDVLEAKPLIGRTFLPAEGKAPGADPVVVLGYRLWKQRYGGDKNILGKTVQINQHAYSVIGVMPRDFVGSNAGLQLDLWVLATMQNQIISSYDRLKDRGANWLVLQGRRKPGVTEEQAQADLNTVMARIAKDFPNEHRGDTEITAFPLWRGPFGANGYLYVLLPMLMAIVAGVLFGALPALRASDMSPMAVLKEDSGSSTGSVKKARLSSVLVVVQIALSLLLLVCSGLFVKSFRAAQQTDPGFNPKGVFVASYNLFPLGYTRDSGVEFHRQVLERVKQVPGVVDATLADWVPLGYSTNSAVVQPEGYVPQPHESMDVSVAAVGPDYLKTLEIPLVAGRDISQSDTLKTQTVAVVNEKFASLYWPGQSAIGKKIDGDGMTFTVVGVAKQAKYDAIGEDPKPMLYMPMLQDYSQSATLHVRVNGDPAAFARASEKAVHAQNADLPNFDEAKLEQRVGTATSWQRIAGTFVGTFGILALVLAAVGIYGLISYTTRQRTREIGIRLAMGAQRADVFRLVIGNGVKLVVVGLAIGFGLSVALTRFLSSILFKTGATDVVTFAAVGLVLAVVALVACYLPARRAMKVDPMVALRYQ